MKRALIVLFIVLFFFGSISFGQARSPRADEAHEKVRKMKEARMKEREQNNNGYPTDIHDADDALPFHGSSDEDQYDISQDFSYQGTSNNYPFVDIADFRYRGAIVYSYDKKIVQGYPDGYYRPLRPLTRAEFVKILIGSKLLRDPIEAQEDCFSDVSQDEWWSSYVCYAKDEDVVSGYEDGSFRPLDTILFKEAAKILVNVFDISYEEDESNPWYHQYIYALSDNYFIPSSVRSANYNFRRGEMAEMIWRIRENIRTQDVNYANILLYFTEAMLNQYVTEASASCSTENDLEIITFPIKNLRTGLDDSHSLKVNKSEAQDLKNIFSEIFESGFSIDKTTTHGYSCRMVAGTNRISQHGFGKAIDINSNINPMMTNDGVILVGSSYNPSAPGTVTRDSAVVKAFEEAGWGWGGDFTANKDYMHFSSNGY